MKSSFGKISLSILLVLGAGIAFWKLRPVDSSAPASAIPEPKSEVARTLPPVERVPEPVRPLPPPAPASVIFASPDSVVMGMVDENWQTRLKTLLGPPVADGLEARMALMRIGYVAREAAAASILTEYRGGKISLEHLGRAFTGWSLQDAPAAEKWLVATNDATLQAALTPLLSTTLSPADTTAAINDFSGMTADQKKALGGEAARVLVDTAGVESLDQLLAREDELQQGSRKDAAILQTIYGVAAEERQRQVAAGGDFDQFTAWMAANSKKPYGTKELFSSVASQVAERADPGAGVNWLATLSKNDSAQAVKDALLEGLASWAKQDAESAREWVGTQSAHPAFALMRQALK